MNASLPLTLLLEGSLLTGLLLLQKRPWRSMLATLTVANVITQSLLWLALVWFFDHYLLVLAVSEIGIVLVEALALCCVQANDCGWRRALGLSLVVNGLSFVCGLFLPV